MKWSWTRASYGALIKGSPKARSRAVRGMRLLDRRHRAYENTSKLPQFTGHSAGSDASLPAKTAMKLAWFAGRGVEVCVF